MIPGLDGEIHRRTDRALLAAATGGLLSGHAMAEQHWTAAVALVAVTMYASLYIAPDAATVTSDWIDYQREQAEEGSEA